jgi:hypothetical protein
LLTEDIHFRKRSGTPHPARLKRKNSDDIPHSCGVYRLEPGNNHPGSERGLYCRPSPARLVQRLNEDQGTGSMDRGTRTYEAFRRGGALARLSLFSSVASLISPHGRIQMLRFALSAVALVGVLVMTQPVFADPLAATASDHAQAAAAAIEQPASPAPAWSSSDAPASARLGRNIAPAGFGWG